MGRMAIQTSSIQYLDQLYSLLSTIYQSQLGFSPFPLTNLARTGHRYEVVELVRQNKKQYFLDNFFELMLRDNSNVASHRVLHSAIPVNSAYHDLPKISVKKRSKRGQIKGDLMIEAMRSSKRCIITTST